MVPSHLEQCPCYVALPPIILYNIISFVFHIHPRCLNVTILLPNVIYGNIYLFGNVHHLVVYFNLMYMFLYVMKFLFDMFTQEGGGRLELVTFAS